MRATEPSLPEEKKYRQIVFKKYNFFIDHNKKIDLAAGCAAGQKIDQADWLARTRLDHTPPCPLPAQPQPQHRRPGRPDLLDGLSGT
jgi:hypothetical protein